jgi:serine/threonine-protein kinase
MSDIRTPLERLHTALRDRYRIERELGQGGMATVYLAEDLKHKRKVALKVLKPELAAVLGAERFVQEITTTASLQHPHILPLFDSGTADGFLFYVMPFIDGETLRTKLDRETQLGIDEAVRIATNVADALDYAHRNGVIHRDIKPENILLHDGRPMVADFGIALALSAAAGGRMTETGLSLGTPHYMSPEQATAEKEITARADVYSLASVLYEMLTGSPPHTGSSAQQIIMKIITEPAAPVTQLRKSVPHNVAAALVKALEKLPADRFATAKEFSDALTNPTFTLHTSAGLSGGALATSRWKERAAIPLAAGAAVLLLAALLGWLRPAARSADVVRVPIELPDSAPLQGQFGILFALSDDGSKIVYTGPGADDIDLWVRPLNTLMATRVPGTEGADSPFLSPDGEVVAFYRASPNALFTVTLRGGPRQTLAKDSMVSLGGDFGPDGSIYFTRRGGIRRIRAGNAAVEEITRVDSAAGEVAHGWVDVLPNGKGVLFTIDRAQEDKYDIAVADLASRKVKILFRGTYARYAPSGHIVYTTADGGLFAMAFDARTLETRGSAIPIVGGVVKTEQGLAHFAIASNGTLLYGSGGGSAAGFDQVEWVDRTGRSQVVDTTLKGPFADLALSADARRLAISQRDGNRWNVWIKDLDEGPMGKLTLDARESYAPSWMPGGGAVAFTSETGDSGDLYLRRADGSAAATLLLHADRRIDYGFVSGDGAWIIYQATAATKSNDLYARRVKSDTARIELAASPTASEISPRLSPDGKWLAYMSNESGQYEIYVSPFPNTTTSRTQVSLNGGSEPLWAASGKELFYVAGVELTSARIEAAPPAIRIASRTPLFSRGAYNRDSNFGTMYAVTPDGNRFIMTRKRGQSGEKLVLVLNWFTELGAAGRVR